MWISRDKNNALRLYSSKPTKKIDDSIWDWMTDADKQIGFIDQTLFPDLKWGDEPMEVEINPKN